MTSRCLLDAVEHLALHAVLQLASTQHQVNHFADGALWVFLKEKTTCCLQRSERFTTGVRKQERTCLRKSWMMACSDTCDPMTNRFLICFSIRANIS